jgi:hypothetical protein
MFVGNVSWKKNGLGSVERGCGFIAERAGKGRRRRMNGKTTRILRRRLCPGAGLGRLGLALFALAALAGCAAPKTSLFPPESSDLSYLAKHAAGRAYEIIGVIQVDGHNFSTENSLKARLRKKARELGADDVMNVRVMSLLRGSGFVKYHVLTAEGIAVRWISPPLIRKSKRADKTTEVLP